MELKLFHFSKRKNSTKQPADNTATATKNVRMKRETSVINPRFLVENIDLSVNYCKWNNNYYFVDDIILNDDDMYELSCTIDALATAKTQILATSANVLYANGSTKNIIDKRIPVSGDVTLSENYKALNDITITDMNMGQPVVGLTGKGSFGSYLMANSNDMHQLIDGVDTWFDGTVETATDAWKQLIHGGSASECLKSAIAIPLLFDPSRISSSGQEQLTLGAYPCKRANGDSIMGYRITNPILTSGTNIAIPWEYSDWRRNPPYSQVALYAPLVGLISLPTSDVINDDNLNCFYAFNVTSGDFSLQVSGVESGRIFATASGNIAIATPFGSTGIDTSKLTSCVIAGAGALLAGATGGASLAVTFGAMAGVALGTMDALGGSGAGNGGLGGGASHALDKVLHCYVASRTLTETQDNLNSIMGKPYMGRATINSFSGYVQTEGFSLSGNYLQQIVDNVNSMMDAGVYIE